MRRTCWGNRTDEEEQSVLEDARHGSGITRDRGYGVISQGSSEEEDGVDADKEIKEQQCKHLEEEGGWFGYLKVFAIFLPYLWPEEDWKIQLCFIIRGPNLVKDRVPNILIPHQTGTIIDMLASGSGTVPWKHIALWIFYAWITSFGGFGYAGCSILAILQIVSSGKPIRNPVILITYWGFLMNPVWTMVNSYETIALMLVNVERLLQLLNTKLTVTDAGLLGDLTADGCEIEFKDVAFSYDTCKPVLKCINFVADPRNTVALVGENGGGARFDVLALRAKEDTWRAGGALHSRQIYTNANSQSALMSQPQNFLEFSRLHISSFIPPIWEHVSLTLTPAHVWIHVLTLVSLGRSVHISGSVVCVDAQTST
ncbi:hypothetical protein K469DRAFT_264785 [Zopfia rhizophila CBS 207.26]|uniref:ABC transmembrane type-1 domain-containing protein n=1 Tax=Zopfia rhizophila CBS 207.26 TaxID=1314779 RepID=A0A6A6DS84_9PEZI|nr:hypothetical protein K469DRAFT_264785 [Zopfia rhizophila CBS 207.26]